MSVHALIVDDFKPYRQFLRSALQPRREVQVIGEAADGLEAVRKAKEGQPDLIFLDIALPRLNGIEVARQIRTVSPRSKIVFVSQESSVQMVKQALRAGAMGYVVKTDAGSELLAAVDAVMKGKTFVSRRLAGQGLEEVFGESSTRSHEVVFYTGDRDFVQSLTRFIALALDSCATVIFVATKSHRDDLHESLQANGVEISAAVEHRRYIPLDAADMLSRIMAHGMPDPAQFFSTAGNLIMAAVKSAGGEHRRVVTCGECAPLLLAEGKPEAAIRLEQLWDSLGKAHGIDILCGYPRGSFYGEVGSHLLEKICAEHSLVRYR